MKRVFCCIFVFVLLFISLGSTPAAPAARTKSPYLSLYANITEIYAPAYNNSRFETSDIPSTPEECYAALDEILSETEKTDIKNAHDLSEYHFGLGMWIRNNWLRLTDSRLADFLYKKHYRSYDDMSWALLEGYNRYLNGRLYAF